MADRHIRNSRSKQRNVEQNTADRRRRYTDARQNASEEQYIYGNTVRALRPIEQEVRAPKALSRSARHNRARDMSMNLPFVLFLTIAMVITGITCIQYIKLQSQVTAYAEILSTKEIELEKLKAENDDTESRIKGAVGLEEIKKRAMDELGMSYAREDQIVTYDSDGTDYVRQFVSLE